jgi:hypothetical protein
MNADATGTFQIPVSDNVVRTQDINAKYSPKYCPDNNPNVLDTRLLNKGVRYDELHVLDNRGWNLEQSFHRMVHDEVGTRRGGTMNVHINRDGVAIESAFKQDYAGKVGSKNSLQARLHRDNIKTRQEFIEEYNKSNRKLGIETHYNLNNNLHAGAEQYQEYQIYKQDSTYDKTTGRNVMFNMDAESKQYIPSITVPRGLKQREVRTNIPRQKHFKAPSTDTYTGAVSYVKRNK